MRLLAAERRLVAHVFDGILPRAVSQRMPLGAEEAGVVDFFEQHLAFLPRRTRWGLRATIAILGVYAAAHPLGARGALARLSGHRLYPLREVVTLVKQVACLGYFTDVRVRAALGLDIPLRTRPLS